MVAGASLMQYLLYSHVGILLLPTSLNTPVKLAQCLLSAQNTPISDIKRHHSTTLPKSIHLNISGNRELCGGSRSLRHTIKGHNARCIGLHFVKLLGYPITLAWTVATVVLSNILFRRVKTHHIYLITRVSTMHDSPSSKSPVEVHETDE